MSKYIGAWPLALLLVPMLAGCDDDGGQETGEGSGSTAGVESTQSDADAGVGTGTTGDGSGEAGSQTESGDDGAGSSAATGDPELELEVNVSISEAIPTVGIVEWSSSIASIARARIEFSREGGGRVLTAPVNLDEPNFRTLLLGMKASSTYRFNIIVEDEDREYRSGDYFVETGPVPNTLAPPRTETADPQRIAPGFTVTSILNKADAVIIDEDGDYVWWYQSELRSSSRARMSYDGRYMWYRDTNNSQGDGAILKISMDGLQVERLDLPDSHHDLTVLEDGTMTYIQRDGADCDDIVELGPDGNSRVIFHIRDVIEPEDPRDGCHTNTIHYHSEDDTYTISLLHNNAYLKFTRAGELVWIFGGEDDQFGGNDWYHQHGHQIIGDHFLFYNNAKAGEGSRVLEYKLDHAAGRAELVWNYQGNHHSPFLGDAQRLDNGNTLVTYAKAGVMQEVTESGEIVHELSWPLGSGLGYSMKRASLYGPPPR